VTTGPSILVFDFDGVLCDSTPECLALTTATAVLLKGRQDLRRVSDDTLLDLVTRAAEPEFREFFFAHRRFVRWPREYWLILERFQVVRSGGIPTLTQADFDAYCQAVPEAGSVFEAAFFTVRDELRRRLFDTWVAMFELWPDVVGGLQALSGRCPVRILTGRDAGSVQAVLARQGLPIPLEHVYDARRFRNKVDGLSALRAEAGAVGRVHILDDNITHLIALLSPGVEAYWATWGYVCPGHADLARDYPQIHVCQRDGWSTYLQKQLERE
jgi:FMN phosphatase YigB (HAD superfamily)